MSALARLLARRLWWALLWLMRRPWMKRLHRATAAWLPEGARRRARRSIVRQNRLARRYGLMTLTFSFNLLLASLALTLTFMAALHLYESGVLTLPDDLRDRLAAR